MQNIETILKDYGITLPEERKEEINKKIFENYVTRAEASKKDSKILKLETERDSYKEYATTAENTLKELGDIEDIKTLKAQVEDWKQRATDAENNLTAKLQERDMSDAVNAAVEDLKFSSEAAKRDVIAQIKTAGLKLRDGKLLGLNDLIDQIKEKDKTAFIDEQKEQLENTKQKRVVKNDANSASTAYKSKEEILTIKDRAERRKAIADNMDLFSTNE